MVLGIAVVYLFDDNTEWLLDIHLAQIARHTTVPFTVYAGVNRLAPRYVQRLAAAPNVKICPIPDTDARAKVEHSYYLDHLVNAAVTDGVTHVVTMHLDSFPVRPGWAERLAATLDARHVFATLDIIHTACLFFSREFYLRHRPAFWPSEAQRASPGFQAYLRTGQACEYSGAGYDFAAYQHHLTGYYQAPVTPLADIGQVFDGGVFHLGGAVHFEERRREAGGAFAHRRAGRGLELVAAIYRRVVSRPVRRRVRAILGKQMARFADPPRERLMDERRTRVRNGLLNDLDAFLQRISPL